MGRTLKRYDTKLAFKLGVIDRLTTSEIAKQCNISIRTIERQKVRENWHEIIASNDDFMTNSMQNLYRNKIDNKADEIVSKVSKITNDYIEAISDVVEKLKEQEGKDKIATIKALGAFGALDKMVRLQELLCGNADKRTETKHLVGITPEMLAKMDSKQIENAINQYKESYSSNTIDGDFTVINGVEEEEYEDE